jgi:hypothetical protein
MDTKRCATCGRTFNWRAKWADDWPNVRYCSNRCRRHKPGRTDELLERAIIELLAERNRNASICPSEAARRVDGERFTELMDRARNAARRLEAAGRIVITQKGRPVDSSRATGPIRLKLSDSSR